MACEKFEILELIEYKIELAMACEKFEILELIEYKIELAMPVRSLKRVSSWTTTEFH